MRRKSPKTHQGPPGPWTPGEGGVAPFDPLASCPSGIVCDNLNPQTSSEAILPRHGLTTESMATVKHREKNKTDLPTQLKVANRSIFLAEGSPARCVSERKKGGNPRTGKVQGRSPWRAFGDFPRDGKVTRGGGAERPPHRGVQRGHRPLAKKFPPLDERNSEIYPSSTGWKRSSKRLSKTTLPSGLNRRSRLPSGMAGSSVSL